MQQTANISSKAWRELNGIHRPPPYDYKNKNYTLSSSWFDKTTKRLDDNSKVCYSSYKRIILQPKAATEKVFRWQLSMAP